MYSTTSCLTNIAYHKICHFVNEMTMKMELSFHFVYFYTNLQIGICQTDIPLNTLSFFQPIRNDYLTLRMKYFPHPA